MDVIRVSREEMMHNLTMAATQPAGMMTSQVAMQNPALALMQPMYGYDAAMQQQLLFQQQQQQQYLLQQQQQQMLLQQQQQQAAQQQAYRECLAFLVRLVGSLT